MNNIIHIGDKDCQFKSLVKSVVNEAASDNWMNIKIMFSTADECAQFIREVLKFITSEKSLERGCEIREFFRFNVVFRNGSKITAVLPHYRVVGETITRFAFFNVQPSAWQENEWKDFESCNFPVLSIYSKGVEWYSDKVDKEDEEFYYIYNSTRKLPKSVTIIQN